MSAEATPATPPVHKAPLSTKLFYGLGSIPYGVKDQGFQTLLLIYYNQVLGLPAIMVSTALLIALLIDACIDPIIGQVSDNWRSKWGRRHPFMYFAALPIAVTYFMLWNPPELSHQGTFVYLIVVAMLVRACLSLYEIPNASLLPELTDDYVQRTSLLSYRYFFGVVGGLAMTMAVFLVFLKPSAEHPVGQLNPDGYFTYSIAAVVVMVALILISSIGTHHLIPTFRMPPQRRLTVLQTVREMLATLAHRSILVILAAGVFSGMASGVASGLAVYLGTYYWALSAAEFAILSAAAVAGTIISVLIATPLTHMFGKKRACIGLFIIAVIVGITPVLLRQAGLFPPNHDPLLLPLLMLERCLITAAGIACAILAASMIADSVEEIEHKTGRRAEGVITAANTFVQKAVSGVGLFAAGAILTIAQFPEGAQPSEVAPAILSNLAYAYAAAFILLFGLSILCLTGYRVTREAHNERLRSLAANATPAE